MTNDNKPKELNFDRLTDTFQEIGKRIHIAKRTDLRVPKYDLEVLLHYAIKQYNEDMIRQSRDSFESAFTEGAIAVCQQPNYAKLSSEEKLALRRDMIAQGKILDFLLDLAATDSLDHNIMRTSVSKAIGGFLYMIHDGNMDNVKKDLARLAEFAEAHAVNFGDSVKGWEQLFSKKA